MGFWKRSVLRVVCAALAGLVVAAESRAADNPSAEALAAPQAELKTRIDRLIEQMGDSDYATRERAQAELARLGHAAFDSLHDAQEHDDVEIAQRAKFLLRSMQIEWTGEDDPPVVQSVLAGYDRLGEADRISRMDQLAALEDEAGVEGMCRIVRFEMSLRMSKEAAVRLIKQPAPAGPDALRQRVRQIRAAMTLSQRPSAQWLLIYADTLENPSSTVDAWDRLVKAEYDAYNLFPDRTRREIVRDLLQFQADLFVRLGRNEEASAAIVRWVGYGEGSRMELLEAMQWLVQRKAWPAVNDLMERHADVFNSDAELLYLAADACLKQDQQPRADEMASRAAGLAVEDFKEHVRLGSVLRDRGLNAWAEREYRRAIEGGPAASIASIQAHLYLSEMLHDVARDREAADVLQLLTERMEKEPEIVQQLQAYRDPGSIASRMHFFYASDCRRRGDREKEKEQLSEAIQRDPADADVLIAMYQLAGQDDEWREDARKRILAARQQVSQQIARIRQYVRQIEGGGDAIEQKMARDGLAVSCNEYAWLVGNTEGDLDEAIRLSHESLELRPNSGGFLDTLAHCYFAKGDFASAVKYQRKAVELEPYSGQIAQALQRFEAALAESQKKIVNERQ